jgi:hypothetical protein
MKKFTRGLSFKEGMLGLLILIIIFLLGNWAYFFLPPEYAKEAQVPNMETILSVFAVLIWLRTYKIIKKINEIVKQLPTNSGTTDEV